MTLPSIRYTALWTIVCCGMIGGSSSFTILQERWPVLRTSQPSRMVSTSTTENQIVSPFDHSADEAESSTSSSPIIDDLPDVLDLTWENVERVLESMRHFLIQDGGNVVIADIDGPIVKLELQGNCGSCPSSTQTMKMGYVVRHWVLWSL